MNNKKGIINFFIAYFKSNILFTPKARDLVNPSPYVEEIVLPHKIAFDFIDDKNSLDEMGVSGSSLSGF